MHKPTVYWDMDGVMAKYDYDMYLPDKDNKILYMVPNAHMYRDMEPDLGAIMIFNSLYANESFCHTKVLTGLGCPYLIAEHLFDKWHWLGQNTDISKEKDFICVTGSKVEAVNRLRPVTKYDILVDDFNPNLEEWARMGGTPVKYVNGINSPRADMLSLPGNDPDTALNMIYGLIKSLSTS